MDTRAGLAEYCSRCRTESCFVTCVTSHRKVHKKFLLPRHNRVAAARVHRNPQGILSSVPTYAMAASKKRRTDDVPQSMTLHHFFGRSGTPGNARKTPSKPKPSEAKSEEKQRVYPPPEEIIVIDSDSEEDLPAHKLNPRAPQSSEYRTRAGSKRSRSSSVCFAEGVRKSVHGIPSASSAELTMSNTPYVSPFGIPTSLLRPQSPSLEAQLKNEKVPQDPELMMIQESSFGIPSALLHVSAPLGEPCSSQHNRHHSLSPSQEPPFGIPITLLRHSSPSHCQPPEPLAAQGHQMEVPQDSVTIGAPVDKNAPTVAGAFGPSSSSCVETECSPFPKSDIDAAVDDFDMNDEWGLGDDEASALNQDPEIDDVEEIDIGEFKIPDDACPLCSMQFADCSLQVGGMAIHGE
ncbi:hypothetical protein NEOLEDRAFT_377623 [Neolentinus lepideus HHB14362 ss-1]|uniref:Uncharacterized protein n=1 Tax=Neolentinus lepideus HHB14362 ss-1 TaxID=1314782 RepID=A0A165SJX3_9AGAM|nr:hypothetical protein NEOLEDRAFT_377623 [Neolentinus lepideus HHB14362 ss-1]